MNFHLIFDIIYLDGIFVADLEMRQINLYPERNFFMKIKEIRDGFKNPSAEYRGKPFWSWNGELREDELLRQVDVMKKMGLGGFFMHSRSGLITEYLGDEWFNLTNAVADYAESIGMEAWLYDEDRWPSGSAGGKVTVDPQYRMKSLYIYEMNPESYVKSDDDYAVFVANIDGINMWHYKKVETGEKVSDVIERENEKCAKSGKELFGTWKVLKFAIVPDKCNSNYNGTTYIDTMSEAAVNRFIELTHEEYSRRCGDRLGRSIKGIFTDEPHRGHAMDFRSEENGTVISGMCWTDDIFDEFEKRYGYSALDCLPELFYRPEGRHVAPVKLHYFDLANNLFIERFARPINKWCREHNIIFTGHVLHEDSLSNQTVPNGSLMRFYEEMGYPGVDVLTEGNRCYWVAKQIQSAARQLGKSWVLSELYGCTGWQFNFKSHKAVGDWQALFGINLRCQHLSWYTMEGESKRDYPASILHQSTWYPYYDKVESYFSRFGLVMREGTPACDVLVINPIESVWCQTYLGWASWISNVSPDIAPYERRYVELFHMLTDNHIDFDYGEEDMLSRKFAFSRDENGEALLHLGEAKYRTVVIGNMLTIRPSTVAILKEFIKMGGKVILAGEYPRYCNAVIYDGPFELADGAVSVPYEEDKIVSAIRESSKEYVEITNADGSAAKEVYVQVRHNFGDAGDMFVVLNTDRVNAKNDISVKVKTTCKGKLQRWNLESGKIYDAEDCVTYSDGYATVTLSLYAAGSACFVISRESVGLEHESKYQTIDKKVFDGEFEYETDEKNVCVIDWVKWRWKDGEWSEKTEVLRADGAIRDSIGIERRGGEMLQPWYSKLHDKNVYGELELMYEFDISEMPKGDIVLAGERPENNHYEINGVALKNDDIHDFWIDDCFKRMHIPTSALKLGTNRITVKTSFMRTSNVEAVYLVGDFGVNAGLKGSCITTLPDKIGCKNLEEYNMPFYTGSITYKLTPDMYRGLDCPADGRIVLSPVSFEGGCVKVGAEGQEDIILSWDPYEADITDAIKAGKTIDVSVVGTRRNVFGPLHQIPKTAGACGPGNFVTGGAQWTDEYSLIDSGLTGIVLKIQKRI